MKRSPRPSLLPMLLLVLALPVLAWAQASPAPGRQTIEVPKSPGVLEQGEIRLTTSIDKEIIRVGDLVHYSLSITAPAGSRIAMPPPGTELGQFLIRDFSFPETDETAKPQTWLDRLFERAGGAPEAPAAVTREFHFTITAYLTGDLSIPPLPVVVFDPAGGGHTLFAESARIRVVPVTKPEDLTIRDIAPPVAVTFRLAAYWPYLLIPVAAAALLASALVLLRRRRREREERIELRPAHEIALEELLELERSDLLKAGEYERFYTRLSHVLRKYLALRYGIYALEYTSEEILTRLKRLDLGLADYEAVRKFLAESDQVKFARLVPELELRKTALERVRAIVEHTRERLPLPEQEAA